MKYLLDTNICIGILNGKEPSLRERLKCLSKGEVTLCSVVKAELLFGARKSQKREENERRLSILFAEFPSLPFDDHAAAEYGALRLLLERAGIGVGANDLMIASIAQAHGLTVITRNTAEFTRIPSISVQTW